MKTTLFNSAVISVSVLALTTSISVASADKTAANDNKTYVEKRPAAEFWAEFKQDSEQTWKDSKAAFKDGWIEGKLETALILNEHLNPFKIDISVDKDIATLEGQVNSEIEKELAENIALGIEGIDAVKNELTVNQSSGEKLNPDDSKGRSLSQYVDDVSTTAAIKTELLASKNIEGLNINVDTLNDKVTLSGKVKTQEQKALAQAIAAKHDDVKDVINNLQVKS